jgi:hypothetical protein
MGWCPGPLGISKDPREQAEAPAWLRLGLLAEAADLVTRGQLDRLARQDRGAAGPQGL